MFKILNKILDAIVAIAKWVLILLISSMTIFLFLAVLSRYLFQHSFYWIDAYSRYSFIIVTFLGAPIVLRLKKHISVDIVIDRLPVFIKKFIVKINVILISIFSYTMLTNGIKLFILSKKQVIPDLFGIKMSCIAIIFPISAILFLLVLLEMFLSPDLTSISLIEGYEKDG